MSIIWRKIDLRLSEMMCQKSVLILFIFIVALVGHQIESSEALTASAELLTPLGCQQTMDGLARSMHHAFRKASDWMFMIGKEGSNLVEPPCFVRFEKLMIRHLGEKVEDDETKKGKPETHVDPTIPANTTVYFSRLHYKSAIPDRIQIDFKLTVGEYKTRIASAFLVCPTSPPFFEKMVQQVIAANKLFEDKDLRECHNRNIERHQFISFWKLHKIMVRVGAVKPTKAENYLVMDARKVLNRVLTSSDGLRVKKETWRVSGKPFISDDKKSTAIVLTDTSGKDYKIVSKLCSEIEGFLAAVQSSTMMVNLYGQITLEYKPTTQSKNNKEVDVSELKKVALKSFLKKYPLVFKAGIDIPEKGAILKIIVFNGGGKGFLGFSPPAKKGESGVSGSMNLIRIYFEFNGTLPAQLQKSPFLTLEEPLVGTKVVFGKSANAPTIDLTQTMVKPTVLQRMRRGLRVPKLSLPKIKFRKFGFRKGGKIQPEDDGDRVPLLTAPDI